MEYTPPRLKEFAELRRGLPTLAAILLVVALALPMWVINVHVVQYPNEVLQLKLFAYPRIAGDFVEMANLNKYIGFYYPDPVYWAPNYDVHEGAVQVPEWSIGWLAFLAVAGAGLFVALAPDTEELKRGLTWQVVGSISVFTIMLADIQYRLYQTGHSLDPDAPVVGVDPFTPPLLGRYEVANITSYSGLGAGAYLTMIAIGLLIVAYVYRDEPVTFRNLPGRIRDRGASLRNRIGDALGGVDRSTDAGDVDSSTSGREPRQR